MGALQPGRLRHHGSLSTPTSTAGDAGPHHPTSAGATSAPSRHRAGAWAPGPAGGEMLRAFGRIRSDPLAFLAEQHRRYGDVVQFPIPRPPTFLVCHPDDVRAVLVTAARTTSKDTIQYRALARVTGEGLLTADGERWREHRRVIQPAFHPRTLPEVGRHTAAATQRLVERLLAVEEGTPVDLDPEVMRLSLEVVGASLFGQGLAGEAERLGNATLAALAEVVSIARQPLRPPPSVPSPGNLRMRRAVAELDAAVDRMLAAPRRPARADHPNLLALLSDSGLPRSAVRDEIVTFLVAGHETVAAALVWSLVLLGRHPATADTIADEARAAFPADSPAGPAGQAVARAGPLDPARLPLATAVVDEALRLYPPAWLITRRTSAALTLSGHRIPADSLLILSPWITQRHASAWPEPERFDPGRFSGGGPPVRHAYLPFGAGPRMCIGRDFARTEAVLALALICRAVRLSASGMPPRPVPSVTLRPDRPVLVRVQPR